MYHHHFLGGTFQRPRALLPSLTPIRKERVDRRVEFDAGIGVGKRASMI